VRVDGWRSTSEGVPQREHAVRRVEEVLAADHVCDVHVDVVDGVGEEEDRRAVRAQDHEVVDQRPLDLHVSPDQVVETAHPRVGCAEPDDARASLGRERGAFRGREVAAVPVVAGGATGCPRRLGALLQLVFGAVALVREAGGEQPIDGLPIQMRAVTLQHGPLVPVEPEPAQRVLHTCDRGVGGTRPVGVLDAQDEHTLLVARVQPVEQSRSRVPDVDLTRRRR
jgi:hypothetical protein